MSRESDDNLSSINSAYTDLYQETVKRFTRSSLSPTSDWERYSPSRRSLKSTTPSTTLSSENGRRTSYDYYLEATGRRRSSDHNSAVLTANTEQFIIGQRVWVGGLRSGQIAYIGETHFAPGDWAGIVLDEPNGKNDGCVSGKRYFQCEPKRGIFSRLTRLTTYPLSGAETPTSPLGKNSPERSRTVSPTASMRSSMLRSPGTGKNGLTVGDRVIVSSGFGSRPGILRYLGETQFAPGNWCGVELDEGSGKNDGAVDGIRYFECKPKFGVFVPIAKVSLSPSTKKTRLSRTGSRESLTSIGTMNSLATTNTSRMRMNAQQRKSSTPIRTLVTPPKNQFSMQDLLREKQQHVEQLMVERDLDREDAQNQALQLQKNINELKARIVHLESQLGDERKKSEELQFSIDEAQFCGDELNAQSQVYREKIHDLESKITQLVSATPSLQSIAAPSEDSAALAKAQVLITQLENQLKTQNQQNEARCAELQEEEQRIRENIKYLQAENETLKTELVSKDESLEKFSLSQSGIDNLRTELKLIKEENERQMQETIFQYEEKLLGNYEEKTQLNQEIQRLKTAANSLESQKLESETLQTEIRIRDEQIKELSHQVDELTTQLNVQKADNTNLDEMLKNQHEEGIKWEEKVKEMEEVKREKDDMETKVKSLEQILKETQSEMEKKIKENELGTQNLEKLKLEMEENKQKQESVQKELVKQVEEVKTQALQREDELKSHIEQLKQEQTNLGQEETQKLNQLKKEILELQNQQKDAQSQLSLSQKELTSKSLELEVSNNTLKKLEKEFEEKTQKVNQLEDELKSCTEIKSKKDLQLGDLQRQHEALQSKTEALNQQHETLQNELLKAQTGMSQLQATLQQLNEDQLAKQQDYASKETQSQTQRLELVSENELLKQTQAKLELELKENLQSLSKLQEEFQLKQTQLQQMEEEAIKKDLTLGDNSRQNENLKERCQSLQQQMETLQQQLNNLESNSNDSQSEMLKLSQKLIAEQKLKEELSLKANEERSQLESQLQSNQQRVDTLCNQVELLTQELASKTAEGSLLQEKLKNEQDLQGKQSLELSDALRKMEAFNEKCVLLEKQLEKSQNEVQAERSCSKELLNSKISNLNQQLSSLQKDFTQQKDNWSQEKLQQENQLQELNQKLQSSQEMVAKLELERVNLKESLTQLQDQITKTQNEHVQLSSGTSETIKDLQERLDITQQDLLHQEQMSRQDAQKISDLKTLVEAIQVANANISATNAELSTVLEVLQAEKSETAHIFELFEMESDMNSARLIEKLTNMKQELKETHSKLEQEQQLAQDMSLQLKQVLQSEQSLNDSALESAEQLRLLQQAKSELSETLLQTQQELANLQQLQQAESLQSNQELQQTLTQLSSTQQQLQDLQLSSQKSLSDHQQLQQSHLELQHLLQQKTELAQHLELQFQELQQKLEKLEQKERDFLSASQKSNEQLQHLQQLNEHLHLSLQQKQSELEKGNEFDAQLVEYQKVIDEMDETASMKSKLLEQLHARVRELELALLQATEAQKLTQQECQRLTRLLESLEQEKAREIVAIKAQPNGTSRQGAGDGFESLDTETSLAKINFLNSIIADMQQKNDALKAKVQTLETLPMDFTKPHAFDILSKRKPAPRLFCDICDEFDKHETEDCPLQASEDRDDSPPPLSAKSEANNNENKERKLPAPRKYCESCEVFGHDTSECADEETY